MKDMYIVFASLEEYGDVYFSINRQLTNKVEVEQYLLRMWQPHQPDIKVKVKIFECVRADGIPHQPWASTR